MHNARLFGSIESLESRRLLSGRPGPALPGSPVDPWVVVYRQPTFTFDNGVLTVTGTPVNDRVWLEQDGDRLLVHGYSFRPGVIIDDAAVGPQPFAINGELRRIEADLGEGNDSITIGKRRIPTLLAGGAGNDTLLGGWGEDTLDGGNGDDLLRGGRADDQLFGRNGRDRLDGGTGQNFLSGGDGRDRRINGGGSDLIASNGIDTYNADIERAGDVGPQIVGLGGAYEPPKFQLKRLGRGFALSVDLTWRDTGLAVAWGEAKRVGDAWVIEGVPTVSITSRPALTAYRHVYDLPISAAKFVEFRTPDDGVLFRAKLG
jgi:hypothetical protein